MDREVLRVVFRGLNRFVIVPAFRLGLGLLFANPLVGYMLVLKTIGRRSGRTRAAPVNYAIIDGQVYCVAGWGRRTHWFVNLKADPRVEVQLPGGVMIGLADEVTDADEARRAVLQVARNAGVGLVFDGLNPFTASDEAVLAHNGGFPVMRIRPTAIGEGQYDPGGRGWLWLFLVSLLLLRRHDRPRRASPRTQTQNSSSA